jgi:hypothetical protein
MTGPLIYLNSQLLAIFGDSLLYSERGDVPCRITKREIGVGVMLRNNWGKKK